MTSGHDLEHLADSLFTPLLEGLGFSRATSERNWWGVNLLYSGAEIGLEVQVDWREDAVYVLLVRMVNGHVPGGYYMFEGKRVRVHIEQVLGISQQKKKRSKATKRVSSEENLATQLQRYSTMVGTESEKLISKG